MLIFFDPKHILRGLETVNMVAKISPRILGLCASASFMAACATDYVPPPKHLTPPPLWAGSAEPDSIRRELDFHPGIKRSGDWLQKTSATLYREGRIVDEIRYKSPFGKEIIIPANTPVHAQQLSVSRTTSYNYMPVRTDNLNALNNPIEWCYSIPADTACIFWEGETRARYIGMVALSQRNLIGFSAAGMIGPMPNIVEGDADFGGPLVAFQRIVDINDEGFSIMSTIKDGRQEEKEVKKKSVILWQGRNQVELDFMYIKPVKNAEGKIDSVEVSVRSAADKLP